MSNQNVPVNTGKIKIGIYYEPSKRAMTSEEMYLQDALLGCRRATDFSDSVGVQKILTGIFCAYAVFALIYYFTR